MPLRGGDSIIPEDPYQAILDGASKDVDIIVGTNADEWDYWNAEMINEKPSELSEEEIEGAIDTNYNDTDYGMIASHFAIAESLEPEAVSECMDLLGDDMTDDEKRAEIANEIGYRLPAITVAYNHAKAGGNSYMYYFQKEATNYDFFGACHASELAYVFHNMDETDFCGEVDEGLADWMCNAWATLQRQVIRALMM